MRITASQTGHEGMALEVRNRGLTLITRTDNPGIPWIYLTVVQGELKIYVCHRGSAYRARRKPGWYERTDYDHRCEPVNVTTMGQA